MAGALLLKVADFARAPALLRINRSFECASRLITDQIGSVRLVVEAVSGSIEQEIEYDAFGRVLSDSNLGFQPFGFAGEIFDQDTGLTHFGAREYDAELGRWSSSDPINFAGGDANLYGYVLGDPVNLVDPGGLVRMLGYQVSPSLQDVSDFSARFGDTATFGEARLARLSAPRPLSSDHQALTRLLAADIEMESATDDSRQTALIREHLDALQRRLSRLE